MKKAFSVAFVMHSERPTPRLEIVLSKKKMNTVVWVMAIMAICVLVSVVLVVVFSTDSPNASMIQWDRMDRKRAEKQDYLQHQQLPPLERLNRLWQQPLPLNRSSNATTRHAFQKLGFSDLSRGLVLAAGGPVLTPQALQLSRELRRSGFALPIQLWYRRGELTSPQIQVFEDEVRVSCCSLETEAPEIPCENRFSLKVLALYLCPFVSALYLDADLHVRDNPQSLWTLLESTSAVFWPDVSPLNRDAPCFTNLTEAQKAQLPTTQQNSAQLLFRLTPEVRTSLWTIYRILENHLEALFPAPYNYGDKDMYIVTWLQQKQPWNWVPGQVLEIIDETGHTVALAHPDPLKPSTILFIQDLLPQPRYTAFRHSLEPWPRDFLPFS